MKTKSIFTPYVARKLLKMGNPIVDIKPCKEERLKTIFVFEVTDKFKEDFEIASKHQSKQKKFSELTGVNGGLLSYDFYLPNHNILIEFQGKQHYEPIDRFGGEKHFTTQCIHDERKREYAKTNQINLLEISYLQIKQIESILEEYFVK